MGGLRPSPGGCRTTVCNTHMALDDNDVIARYTRSPNEDVAAAIDALARQVPSDVTVDLLVLGSDTIRAALTGRGRAMDVIRPRGAERCHVTLHTIDRHPPRWQFARRGAAIRLDIAHYYDVAIGDLGALLAQPHPGSATRLFTPRDTATPDTR